MGRRQRVAVLGGGAGALSAAFELTATPQLRERFEVTVHQAGWRLGGKGASGRDLERNGRIEEHGLRVWFGFYRNAFDLVRRCYEELGDQAPEIPWTRAFDPIDRLVLFDQEADGTWSTWPMPPLPAQPLDPDRGDGEEFPGFARTTVRWLLDFWDATEELTGPPPQALEQLRLEVERPREEPDHYRQIAALLAETAIDVDRDQLGAHGRRRSALSLFRRLADLWGGLIAGLLAEDVLRLRPPRFDPQAVERLDREELRAWLRPRVHFSDTLESPFVCVLYDLAFGYEHGVRPDLAAGMAVQNLFRILFAHGGSLMSRMRGGMGDVVFAPLYDVLRARGVTFEFFHWVTCLRLGSDGRSVRSVEVVPQVPARVRPHDPLIEVGGRRVWPNRPWPALADANRLLGREIDFEREANPLDAPPITLAAGRDFDLVVLGIPPGPLPAICAQLSAASPAFEAMLQHTPTVATQALQLWRTAPAPGARARGRATIAGAYAKPFDTWCDMSHVIEEQSWPRGSVRHIAYLVGVLPDGPVPGTAPPASRPGADCPPADHPAHGADPGELERATLAVYENAEELAARPKPPQLDTGQLASPGGEPGGGIADQFWRANVGASERYVLSPAGRIGHRLAAGESGFSNLILAGDWTRTAINVGSVEAAVVSGRHAAAAIIERATGAVE